MSLLNQLGKEFPPEVIKSNQGRPYVPIDKVLARLADVLEGAWDLQLDPEPLQVVDDVYRERGAARRAFLAQVRATITVRDGDQVIVRDGVGADISPDPDKALKTAQANAVKKAAQQFGVGAQLWDENYRADLDKKQAQAQADKQEVKAIKQEILRRAAEWSEDIDLGFETRSEMALAYLDAQHIKTPEADDLDQWRRIIQAINEADALV